MSVAEIGTTETRGRNRAAFTLIELLIVIAIIGMLAGMLLTGVQMAKQKAREVVAKTEVSQLEIALKKYYQEYQRWPTIPGLSPEDMENEPVVIVKSFAAILQGDNDSDNNNPKRLPFMDFKTVDKIGDPANPWGKKYYCKFDTDYDNQIRKGSGKDPPKDQTRRPVIVWTQTVKGKLIASWQ